jgi:hypothetical protein
MSNQLVKGSGCGTREWRESFALTDTDGLTGLFTVDRSGNCTVSGTLTTGATIDNSGAIALTNNLDTTGNLSCDGTLVIDGASTLTGAVACGSTLAATGNLAIATNKFNVTAASGNTAIAGTLAVTGATTLTGDLVESGNASIGKVLSLAGIETALTAHAGGTQAAALALSSTKMIHNIATVGTAADSVVLPASAGTGAVHIVMNSAASNAMQVYGLSADTINGVAAATGISLAAGKSAVFVDYAAGTWFMLKSA